MSRRPQNVNKTDAQTELIPRLRFPEFRDLPGWKSRRLGDALKFQPGYPFPSSGFNEGGTGLRLIRNRDLRSDDAVIYYSSSYDEAFVVNDGDVLIGMDGDFTPCVWDKGQALLNQRVGRITPKAKSDLQFLRYFLTAHLKDIEDATPRTTVKHLSHSDVERLDEALPEPAEQQKIAACLGSLDDLIAAEGRKLAVLRDHKKGLMQQLFPREGETRPERRFPEFRDAPEWEPTTLQQLANIQSGGTPSKGNPAFWNGSIPWVSAKDMKRLFLEDAEDHISTAAVDDGARLVPPGTLLMLTRGMTLLKDVPICVLRREMAFNQDVKALLPKDAVDSLFLALLLLGNKERLLKMVDVAGHGTGKLNTEELRALELVTPQPAEQQRIADCLASLDAMIAAQAEKLDALRTHKRGLMQQLFPSPEEVAR